MPHVKNTTMFQTTTVYCNCFCVMSVYFTGIQKPFFLFSRIFKNSLWLIISWRHFAKFITMRWKEFQSPAQRLSRTVSLGSSAVISNLLISFNIERRASAKPCSLKPSDRSDWLKGHPGFCLQTARTRCEKQSKKGNSFKWCVPVIVTHTHTQLNECKLFFCVQTFTSVIDLLESISLQSQWTEKIQLYQHWMQGHRGMIHFL